MDKRKQHASCRGVLLGHIFHIYWQMHAPASGRVKSRFSKCVHVNKSTLNFPLCAYLSLDANT
eukprot:1152622-Pelagomonas_calceolata.AAC.2